MVVVGIGFWFIVVLIKQFVFIVRFQLIKLNMLFRVITKVFISYSNKGQYAIRVIEPTTFIIKFHDLTIE